MVKASPLCLLDVELKEGKNVLSGQPDVALPRSYFPVPGSQKMQKRSVISGLNDNLSWISLFVVVRQFCVEMLEAIWWVR